jgi:LysM repeat protein
MNISRRELRRLIEHVVQSEVDELYYTVMPGDTLESIGLANDITVEELVSLNGIEDPDNIQAGYRLVVSRDALTSDFRRGEDWVEQDEIAREELSSRCPGQTTGQPPQWGSLPALTWLDDMVDAVDSDDPYLSSIADDIGEFVVSDAKRATLDNLFARIAPESYIDIRLDGSLEPGEILSLLQGIEGDSYTAFQNMIRRKLESINCDLAFTITREDLEGLGS